jgi:hypothetical protein
VWGKDEEITFWGMGMAAWLELRTGRMACSRSDSTVKVYRLLKRLLWIPFGSSQVPTPSNVWPEYLLNHEGGSRISIPVGTLI